MSFKNLIETVKDLKTGSHLCCLYVSEEERDETIVPYISSGLYKSEQILYIVDSTTGEHVLNILKKEGQNIENFLNTDKVEIHSSDSTYLKDGVFDPDRMIELLRQKTEDSLSLGFTCLRVTGEMTWALRDLPGSDKLIEYEAKLNNFFLNNKAIGMCQYDMRRFSSEILLDVLSTHPLAVIGTEIYDNFYYIPPDEFLGPDRQGAILRQKIKNLKERKNNQTILNTHLKEQEREVFSLENFSTKSPTPVTSGAFGSIPLYKEMPDKFNDFVCKYRELLRKALEEKAFKVEHNTSEELYLISQKLGFFKAGPKDVVYIHTTALKEIIKDINPIKVQNYLEEGRIMLLELMGYLVSYYRNYGNRNI